MYWIKSIIFVVLVCASRSAGQCGPKGSMPYPPGKSECPDKADGMEPHKEGGGGDAGGGGSQTTCSQPPCAAALLGDVGFTTVSGTDERSGITFSPGENIYGPFEAGFGSQQEFILEGLGCSDGSLGHVDGGIDTNAAEQLVAHQCSIKLPRTEGETYISLLDECGGHTKEYHFHERLACLYSEKITGHSTQVGKGQDGQLIYGKYESTADSTLPLLDACGGHFGITPDSDGKVVYHYHVQEKAPFTFGCFGPDPQSDGSDKLVTLEKCRSLYSGCGDGDQVDLTTGSGTRQYDPWCPCFDATGSNVGTAELPVFTTEGHQIVCEGGCSTFTPVKGGGGSGGGGPGNGGPGGGPGPLPLIVAVVIGSLVAITGVVCWARRRNGGYGQQRDVNTGQELPGTAA